MRGFVSAGRVLLIGLLRGPVAWLRHRGTAEAAVPTWPSYMAIPTWAIAGRTNASVATWLLAFHCADISGVYACFFGFQEAAEDFSGARFGERGHEFQRRGSCDRAQFPADVFD
jgi:hypothetical protein